MQNQTAHIKLTCTSSGLGLERVLQTVRYRGFRVTHLSFNDGGNGDTQMQFVVNGQAKLTTLQKSLEALIEVQQCYLTEDKAKLATLLAVGQVFHPTMSNTAQSAFG